MSEPISTNPDGKERLIGLALDGLPSPHTRRAYRVALDEFLTWSQGQQPPVLCKALVNRYKAMLIEKELAPATINQRLAAHRLLAEHGHDSDLRIGVAKSGAAGFAAHAWVECGGAVLVGQTDSEYSLLLEWSPRP